MKTGDLITDSCNRRAIVGGQAGKPDKRWLMQQADVRLRHIPKGAPWFRCYYLTGGCRIQPAALCTLHREAREDERARVLAAAGPTMKQKTLNDISTLEHA